MRSGRGPAESRRYGAPASSASLVRDAAPAVAGALGQKRAVRRRSRPLHQPLAGGPCDRTQRFRRFSGFVIRPRAARSLRTAGAKRRLVLSGDIRARLCARPWDVMTCVVAVIMSACPDSACAHILSLHPLASDGFTGLAQEATHPAAICGLRQPAGDCRSQHRRLACRPAAPSCRRRSPCGRRAGQRQRRLLQSHRHRQAEEPELAEPGVRGQPAAAWNRRVLQMGGGGYNGTLVTGLTGFTLQPANVDNPLKQGFVTARHRWRPQVRRRIRRQLRARRRGAGATSARSR